MSWRYHTRLLIAIAGFIAIPTAILLGLVLLAVWVDVSFVSNAELKWN